MPHLDELITTTEATRITGIPSRTLQRYAAKGALRSAQKLPGGNGARLYRRADVLRFAAEWAEGRHGRTGTQEVAS